MTRLFILAFLLLPLAATAQTRAAFVVGNAAYDNAQPLANPARDARLIGETLEGLGFAVETHFDLTRAGLTRALGAFLKTHENAEVTLFYFAGHGMQFEGRNYLVGTDAVLASEFDVEAEALALDRVVAMLERRSKAALVFVDACRDNPLADRFYRENFSQTRALMTRGLAPVKSASDGAMLVFSAAPGQVALDGQGENSPFAAALARHLPTENIEVLSLMKRVIRDVKLETGEAQTPTVTNDLTTEIYLRLGEGGTGAALALQQEEKIFEAAAAIGSARAWDLYLARFPDGAFREMALAERERLTASEMAAASGSEVVAGGRIAVTREVAAAEEAKLGLGREDNRAVQAALNARGYNAGAEDGIVGRGTRKAVADFQAAVGLPSTGVITAATAERLGLELASAEEGTGVIVASANARRYDPDQLALIEDDPRLIKAARALEGKEFVYGLFGGNLYIAVLTWRWTRIEEARRLAAQAGGYLATLTSEAENDFAFSLIAQDDRFWKFHSQHRSTRFGPTFGLYQLPNSKEPAGGWVWATNEPVTFTNWLPGSPINAGGNASYAAFIWDIWPREPTNADFAANTWHDFSEATPSLLIEID